MLSEMLSFFGNRAVELSAGFWKSVNMEKKNTRRIDNTQYILPHKAINFLRDIATVYPTARSSTESVKSDKTFCKIVLYFRNSLP